MRVRISTNPPLQPVKVWFALSNTLSGTIASFKSALCSSIPALRVASSTSLRLFIDGFELLDNSELSILRDGDLICVDAPNTPSVPTSERGAKRKRLSSSSSSSSSPSSEPTTDTDSETESESESSCPVTRQEDAPKGHVGTTRTVQPKPRANHLPTFVPPGYGKPQTRSRNLRRRLKRVHERSAREGPTSDANAIVRGQDSQVSAVPDTNEDGPSAPTFMSLSLRNKNKAKNFKSFMKRPLPPKIVFGEQDSASGASGGMATSQVMPRLIPPSSRSSLPPNLFVTSVDVEANPQYGDGLEEGSWGDDEGEPEVDIEGLKSIAEKEWDTLDNLTRETPINPGTIVGYKGLGVNPETYTPEHLLTLNVVVQCGEEAVEVRPLRAVSFSGPVDAEAVSYEWEEIEPGNWKVMTTPFGIGN